MPILAGGQTELAVTAYMSVSGLTGTITFYDPYADADIGTTPAIAEGGNRYRGLWDLTGVTLPTTNQIEARWLMSNSEEGSETIDIVQAGVTESVEALLARLGELGVVPVTIQPGATVYVGQKGVKLVVPTGKEVGDLATLADPRIRVQRMRSSKRAKQTESVEVIATLDGTDLVYFTIPGDGIYGTDCGTYKRQGTYLLGTPPDQTFEFTDKYEQTVVAPLPEDSTPP